MNVHAYKQVSIASLKSWVNPTRSISDARVDA